MFEIIEQTSYLLFDVVTPLYNKLVLMLTIARRRKGEPLGLN